MSNILVGHAVIRGVRPLLIHRFGPESISLVKQERTGVAGNDPEEWRKSILATAEGQLYFTPPYIFGTIREGAKYTTKKGKASYFKDVSATLQVVDDRVLLDRWFPGFPNGHHLELKTIEAPATDDSLPVYLDIRSVVNPNTRSRNVRYRLACAAGWGCEFSVMWDKTIIDRSLMKTFIIDAGRFSGLGSGRSIGMGRFELVSFEVQDA